MGLVAAELVKLMLESKQKTETTITDIRLMITNYDNHSDNDRLSITYRHYIGTACTKQFRKVQQQNMELKQRSRINEDVW